MAAAMVKKEPRQDLTKGRRRNFQQLLDELQELLPHTDSSNTISTLENAVSFVRQNQGDISLWAEPAICVVERLGLVLDGNGTIFFATPSCAAAMQADSVVQPEIFLRTEAEEYLHVRVTRKLAASRATEQPVQICFLDVLGGPAMPAGGLVPLCQDPTVQPYYMLSLHTLPTLDCLSFWCSVPTVLGLELKQLQVMKPFENMHPDDAQIAGLAARQGFERMKPFVMQMRMINVATQRWEGGQVEVTPCIERGTGALLGALATARNVERPFPPLSRNVKSDIDACTSQWLTMGAYRVMDEQNALVVGNDELMAVIETKMTTLRLQSEREEAERKQTAQEEEQRVFTEHGRLLAALRSSQQAVRPTTATAQPKLR